MLSDASKRAANACGLQYDNQNVHHHNRFLCCENGFGAVMLYAAIKCIVLLSEKIRQTFLN